MTNYKPDDAVRGTYDPLRHTNVRFTLIRVGRLLQEQGEGPLLCWTLSTTLSDIVRKWAYSTVFLDEPTLAAIAWRLDMEVRVPYTNNTE